MKIKARTKLTDFLFIVFTAFLTGMLWRMRGDHGWGGFAGMALVTCGLFLSVAAYLPHLKKITFEIFPVVVFLSAITNEGWGTLNSQITGYLEAYSTDALREISPLSGVLVMLILGFGWMPFFAAALGYYFSDKKWSLIKTAGMIAVFYAAVYICKASVSHFITDAVFPEASSAFADGLKNAGMDASPFKAYLAHFDNIGWGKKIEFGRNYFQTVEVISQAIGAAAVSVYIKAVIKDGKAALISFFSCLSCAAAITLADISMFVSGGGIRNSFTAPEWISGWSIWEYSTGFFLGLFTAVISLIAAGTKKQEASLTPARITPDKKPLRFIVNYGITFCFPVIAAFVIPLAGRITDENDVIFSFIDFKNEDILTVPLCIIAAAAMIYPALRFTKSEKAEDDRFFKAAPLMVFSAAAASSILYFCFGNAYLLNGSSTDISILMYVSAVVVFVCYALLSSLYFFPRKV